MPSDAFIVGEDWISEHYFNTESAKQSFQGRVTARRKDWDERESAGEKTPRSRLAAAGATLTSLFSTVDADAGNDAVIEIDADRYRSEVLAALATALGYEDARWRRKTSGPITLLAPKDAADVSAAMLFARPVADVVDLLSKNKPTLLEPFLPEDETGEVMSVARALSWLFTSDEAPAFAVVLSGAKALVVERERWAEGRYLAVDLQLVLDRNEVKKRGGEFDRAVAVLAAESVSPDVDGTTWWAETLEDSVKHTVGVSKDLRDGVRESIEIIANEVVRRRAAQCLDPLPASEANTLARQSLRYLYRVLFLLFAEASPELRVLPVGAPEYALGYGLDRLRELVLVELGEESRHRTHLHESLDTLFRLVDAGHEKVAITDEAELPEGLEFHPLSADLFRRESVALIDAAKLGDGALQRVLSLLLLTREERTKKGGDRGFISYADLGINQLGAVYEGLMSYSGFFAETDLFEVAKDGDSSKGSWVVPVERAHDIAKQHFVMAEDPITHERVQRRYRGGEFVFRLSGRERQTSASYYSPEVLTKFVVGQALEELLDQDGHTTSAEEVLDLSVCEPALGSGAFAIEAVRQLADEYLTRREQEVGQRIDPDERPRELQKAKAAIALHQVYGVDLNATAVELAEISLWLDTMVDGLQAPWFGLRLRRGNSLIGAKRAVYTQKQVNDKAWLKDTPTDVTVSALVDDMRGGRIGSSTSGKIHHFLVPAEGWGSAVDAKEARELAPEAHTALREWRKTTRVKPSKKQLERLVGLGHRVEALWQFALRRLEIAERQVSRELTLWNDPRPPQEGDEAVVGRLKVEAFLNDDSGAYRRLRRVMDAWCALWFWPLTDDLTQGAAPPNLDEWLDGVTALIGGHSRATARKAGEGAQQFGLPTGWDDLEEAEKDDLDWSSALDVDDALASHPWLRVTERIADANGFFHWELDFAGVFARGGFDLQVGNPPWVRPRSDVDALLAEGDPWWQLAVKPTQTEVKAKREQTLEIEGIRDLVVDGTADVACTAAFVGSPIVYPHLAGLQPDLYRCFMELTWSHLSPTGAVALIHPESHFTDEKAGYLRQATYEHLRRHWQFINELSLFEIHHLVSYGVHVYGAAQRPRFRMATNLYHPETVVGSLRHNGDGPEPGIKNVDGKWDLSAHSGRITLVDDDVLRSWHGLLEDESTPIRRTRMVYAVNRATAAVLAKLADAPRLGSLGLEFSRGWDESIDRKKGYFDVEWGEVESWDQAILQGPHLFVGNPFYKSPNSTMLHNLDWSPVDLETLAPNAMPITSYKPAKPRAEYDAGYTHWGPDRVPARDHYRVAWRKMAANTGERTLISSLVPPGTTHIDGMLTVGAPNATARDLLVLQAYMSSISNDMLVRAAPKANIRFQTVANLAGRQNELTPALTLRVARLNMLTSVYTELVSDAFDDDWRTDRWSTDAEETGAVSLSIDTASWTSDFPLRRASDRRQAQVEIDAIVALSLGITADELCTIYRTQFAVLYGYDRNTYFYDANGRLVPNEVLKVWRQKGDAISQDERTSTNASGNTYEYELPFVTLDREADMRQAYAHFEKILQERS
ncbi:methylase of polypeptide subunit release factors [Microbacterium phyllosphaerae]|uniref:site-specific DNA-methyltransferase (adenine-specific) n=1 Tax=Microbacterium phyllosphaerae TaxID=124798 RepID=A0ABS4WM47_9MICO|nr:class I SAM-dependent DNA methyltransferase [Microbacterium phyllosphaerae]MBP2377284.1 methylase of polypeptide subunit release factors [Microbacterium phyllosphaerae]